MTNPEIQAVLCKFRDLKPVPAFGECEWIFYCPACKVVDFLSKHVAHEGVFKDLL